FMGGVYRGWGSGLRTNGQLSASGHSSRSVAPGHRVAPLCCLGEMWGGSGFSAWLTQPTRENLRERATDRGIVRHVPVQWIRERKRYEEGLLGGCVQDSW